MNRINEGAEFEERQSKLADFLRGRPCSADPTDEDMQAWYTARTMLRAPELLDACEYALTLIRSLSSEDFIAGGDKPARERLAEAVALAKEGTRKRDEEALLARCSADVREAIRNNRATVL